MNFRHLRIKTLNMSGLLLNEGGNPKKVLYSKGVLISEREILPMIKTLVHELRHVWQHQREPKKYFSNYSYELQYIDIDKYFLQDAEVDAEAFALKYLHDEYDRPIAGWNNSAIVNSVVERRAKSMPKI